MAEDVIAYLQEVGYGDLIVLPRVMFDHPDIISLDDLAPQEVANRLKRPIALADTMGDVWDAVTSVSRVVFDPDS
jgi:NifB/MoaA-like Fe-S oxidoreductase